MPTATPAGRAATADRAAPHRRGVPVRLRSHRRGLRLLPGTPSARSACSFTRTLHPHARPDPDQRSRSRPPLDPGSKHRRGRSADPPATTGWLRVARGPTYRRGLARTGDSEDYRTSTRCPVSVDPGQCGAPGCGASARVRRTQSRSASSPGVDACTLRWTETASDRVTPDPRRAAGSTAEPAPGTDLGGLTFLRRPAAP